MLLQRGSYCRGLTAPKTGTVDACLTSFTYHCDWLSTKHEQYTVGNQIISHTVVNGAYWWGVELANLKDHHPWEAEEITISIANREKFRREADSLEAYV